MEKVLDYLLLGLAAVFALWASTPPRGTRRRWLVAALLALWGALLLVGWRRGVQPGFVPWLLALAFVGALLGLLALWSVAALGAHPRAPRDEKAE